MDDILGEGQRRRRREGGSDDRYLGEDEPPLVARLHVDVRLLRDGVPYDGRRRHGAAIYLASLARRAASRPKPPWRIPVLVLGRILRVKFPRGY